MKLTIEYEKDRYTDSVITESIELSAEIESRLLSLRDGGLYGRTFAEVIERILCERFLSAAPGRPI